MSTLSDILQYKEYQDNVQRDNAASIGRAFDTFNQVRQQGIQNQLASLQTRGQLAEGGIGVGPDGSLRRDNSLLNPVQMIMQGAQLQANAKTAGNAQLYNMSGNLLSSMLGGGGQQQQPQQPQQPVQPPSLLDQFVKGSDNAAAVASANAMIHNQNQANAGRATALEDKAIDHSNAIDQTMAGQTAEPTAEQTINQAPPKQSDLGDMGGEPDYTTQKDPFTGEPTLQARLQQAAVDVGKTTATDTKKYGDTQATGFANAAAKLQLTLENWHKMVQSTQQATGFGPGRINGVLSKVGGATGSNPYYEPFKTSLLETEVQLAKLSAPSARIGPDLIKTFGVVAPTEFSNSKEAKNNFVTSLTNAYSTYATSNPDKFPKGADIDKFQGMAGQMYDNIIGQTALSSQFQDGKKYTTGGKTLTFKNGQFLDDQGKPVNVSLGSK